MTDTRDRSSTDSLAETALEEALSAESQPGHELKVETDDYLLSEPVDRSSYHEFAQYQYVFEPWALRRRRSNRPTLAAPEKATARAPIDAPGYAPADLKDFSGLSLNATNHLIQFFDDVAALAGDSFDPEPLSALVFRLRLVALSALIGEYASSIQAQTRADQMLVLFLEKLMADVLDPFEKLSPEQRDEFFLNHFDPAIEAWALRSIEWEMPWLVANEWDKAYYEVGGYEIGEAFGRTPTALDVFPDFATSLNQVTSVAITYSEQRCHDRAWSQQRRPYWGSSSRLDPVHLALTAQNGKIPPLVVEATRLAATGASASEVEEKEEALERVLGSDGNPASAPPVLPEERYGFQPYPVGSVNFGLRSLYRQTWVPRGVGPGELVRTIPLGPGQKENVAIKRSVRTKTATNREQGRETTSTREQSLQTTDSSEVVAQAASSSKWNVETSAEASFSLGVWGGSAQLSAGYASESSRASQNTKKHLSDSMQKASQSIKQQSRVQVQTESESMSEYAHTSELVNQNQEVSITYLYETLQRIYDVTTEFAGVEGVILVGENVPTPEALNRDWVRRHDWILSRVLLDESFRETLELVTSAAPVAPANHDLTTLGLDEVTTLSEVLDAAKQSLKAVQQLSGDIANTYEATLNAYGKATASARSRMEEARTLRLRVDRFMQHLADNILYYCRAIWSAEDPERRLMRYQGIRVPTAFAPYVDVDGGTFDPAVGDYIYNGVWAPTSWLPLSEVVDPDGPLAYVGNYSVFRLKKTPATTGITRIIRQASQAYHEVLPPLLTTVDGRPLKNGQGPQGLELSVEVVDTDYYAWHRYILIFGGAPGAVEVLRLSEDGAAEPVAPVVVDSLIMFDGLKVSVTRWSSEAVRVRLLPVSPSPVDPEIKYLQLLSPESSRRELEAMLRTNNTRQILVDTGNLWLSVLRGRGTVLEDFKLRHRRLDVALARTELARRLLRLRNHDLDDPEIDRRVVVENGVASTLPPGVMLVDTDVDTAGASAPTDGATRGAGGT